MIQEQMIVTVNPNLAEVRKTVGLSNNYKNRYRIDFEGLAGRPLKVERVNEQPKRDDLMLSKRAGGHTIKQVLYRLSGALLQCKCHVTGEMVFIDLETLLIPGDAIDRTFLAGCPEDEPPIPNLHC